MSVTIARVGSRYSVVGVNARMVCDGRGLENVQCMGINQRAYARDLGGNEERQ